MRVLVTAGGTREYIDPVRFISNASSGKMGYAVARAALKAGHTVTLVTAPTTARPPAGAQLIRVETAAKMFAAVKKHFVRCDCLVMAAAVADYTPAHPSKTKIKKQDGRRFTLQLELKPTPDILRWAGQHKKKGQIVVGFALEDRSVRRRAEAKMAEKNLDVVVLNSPAAIGAERSSVQIKVRDDKWLTLTDSTKTAIARRLIRLAEMAWADTAP